MNMRKITLSLLSTIYFGVILFELFLSSDNLIIFSSVLGNLYRNQESFGVPSYMYFLTDVITSGYVIILFGFLLVIFRMIILHFFKNISFKREYLLISCFIGLFILYCLVMVIFAWKRDYYTFLGVFSCILNLFMLFVIVYIFDRFDIQNILKIFLILLFFVVACRVIFYFTNHSDLIFNEYYTISSMKNYILVVMSLGLLGVIKNVIFKYFAFLNFILSCFLIIISPSRGPFGGFIVFLLATLVFVLYCKLGKKIAIISSIISFIIALFVLFWMAVIKSKGLGDLERKDLMAWAFSSFTKKILLFGRSPNHFVLDFTSKMTSGSNPGSAIHNSVILFIFDFGISGTILYLIPLFIFLPIAIYNLRKKKNNWGSIVFLAFQFSNLANIFMEPSQLVFGFTVFAHAVLSGLVLREYRMLKSSKIPDFPKNQ
jgi:hypothetical protein